MSNQKEQIRELLNRGVVDCIDRSELESKLASGKPLRIKLGIDPTGDQIHVGRAVPLRKLAAFQRLGHQIVFIIGDFTGTIGDTSDKDSERPMLDQATVDQNASTYLEQIGKILDIDKCEIHHNSEWFSKLPLTEFLGIANHFTLAETIQRDNFAKRLKAQKRISLREVLYPLLQAYDSVQIRADVELGGQDQLFNILAGRTLQKAYEQPQQNILTFPLLLGTDGRKMSTSWGNCIYITDTPTDIYGKAMRIPDDLIVHWVELATDLDYLSFAKRMKAGENPRILKGELASELVRMYHDEAAAVKSAEEFITLFREHGKPEQIDLVNLKVDQINIVELLVITKLSPSKSEARRLVEQGGVKVDDQKLDDPKAEIDLSSEHLIQAGKRKWLKVIS